MSGLPPRPTTPIDESIPAWEPLFNIPENAQIPEGSITIPETPQAPQILRSERCSRDTRIRVETLRALGKTYRFIADFLGITIRQVHYALNIVILPKAIAAAVSRCLILLADEISLIGSTNPLPIALRSGWTFQQSLI